MMRKIFLPLIAVLVSSLTLSAAKADDVIAVVGSKSISVKEFNEKYEEVVRQTINPPSKELFIEDLVRYEMGVQEAVKKNLQDDPIVKERIRQEIYKGLIEKEIGKKISEIKVSEKEMQAYYKKNPEIKTSHILTEFKADATEEQIKGAKERAEKIFDEVKKSKRSFEELVKLYTDDVLTRGNGGDVGWQSGVTLVPPYYQAALNSKVGEMKGLIRTQYGFHIIKVTGRHEYGDANKRQIRASVFDAKRKDIFDEYFAKLKKTYPTKINKDKLK